MTEENQTDPAASKDIPPWLQPVPEGEDEAVEAAGRRKLILTSVATLVVIGLFVSVILYLYDGSEKVIPKHVTAPTEAIKQRPDEAGGMQIAHQDKQVFNRVDGSQMSNEVKLGAQPEEPVAELPEDPVVDAPIPAKVSTVDVIAQAIEEIEKPNPSKSVPSKPIEEKATTVKTKPKPSVPVKKAVVSPIDDKAYRVQLGAYGSEKSAANAWRAVKTKFSNQLTGKSPSYEAVTSGSRTLYRLRVGVLATRAEADQVCLALRAGQQACIVVNP